ncbi:protein NEN1-like [Juglans microcarpa x Juglans regia]|uniref:protein NEN1-like n=1 Tax=Juglans microcarpa x Juglans regia TaxID=2249226 RepID=UPI001B7E4A20|nr:protein NEN1-like [Juglans microcarpa x Juglans regia]
MEMGTRSSEERSEIAFFDVETTVPTRPGQGFAILEFGAILVCPRKLEELYSYSTLLRPSDLSLISSFSVRCNGITREAVVSCPTFREVADRVYDILHGRIWAGHNILKFDCRRIQEAFAEIGRPAPEPKGTIDSLPLLTQKFGRRAGDMKMATLASYFGLGQQTHRSLDDVRMNLEVLKYCATVLFLESSLPDTFTANGWVSPNATARSHRNANSSPDGVSLCKNMPSSSSTLKNDLMLSRTNQQKVETRPILSPMTDSISNTSRQDPFDMGLLRIESESLQTNTTMEEMLESSEITSTAPISNGCCNSGGFLEPDEVSISAIGACFVPFHCGSQKIQLLHEGAILQLCCTRLKVRFGLSMKFVDHAGRPRLNFVVNASQSLCKVLDACDAIAQKLSLDSGSSSEWKPVVSRKNGFVNNPTVRLHIPTAECGDIAVYGTEMYQKETSGAVQRLVFSKFDAEELDTMFTSGTFVDAFFSLDAYDYLQNAGIRLVAKKLIIHSN